MGKAKCEVETDHSRIICALSKLLLLYVKSVFLGLPYGFRVKGSMEIRSGTVVAVAT
jgi:hypothetical protein